MTYADLIKHFGSERAAAEVLGIKAPSVYGWRDGGIPEPRQAQYQLITGGTLRADLPKPAAREAA